ncbi:MAG: molybdopterin-dependent oxidoreductase [Desulfovibrio sp.]|nr:molybdopterin-dependent oxidoreductase [Desulfovibrio sp.]
MNDDGNSKKQPPPQLSRRGLLKGLIGGGVLVSAQAASAAPLRFLKPLHVDNPLASYPSRDWEKAYRDIFRADSSFVFLCAPNDTHNCLLRAHVKNGVVARIGPTYGYGQAEDLYGNRASHRWDPRLCQKGLALVRRIYGDRRVKSPMVRRGWKEWVDAGFPRGADGRPDPKYFQRGKDKWLRASWPEAYDMAAKALENIARTYSGPKGTEMLRAQGYDPAMVEAIEESGAQTIKCRGGMAFLGATRIFGLYRFANSLALMDAKVRNVPPEKAHSARGWDSYSWHTDLPPGHPMVTGAQTNDFDLFAVEQSKLCLAWGMNWITTKMPDSHWLTEARLKGTKVVSITVEYSATASKSDDVIVIRPGTDPAFALGLAQVILSKKLYDESWVARNTDLPFLIRLDTLQPLRPEEVIPGYKTQPPANLAQVKKGEKPTPANAQRGQLVNEAMAGEFLPFVVFDKAKKPVAVTRDEWGEKAKSISPQLFAKAKLKTIDGKEVEVRTVADLMKEYLDANLQPEQVEALTGAPKKAVVGLATEIAKNPEKTLFANGMGPNQFYNADLKDRAIFLVAALTRNVGFLGGNVGSYAGNYRGALFAGLPTFVLEDPFNVQLDPTAKVQIKKILHYDSLHYYNYGDRPLRVGNKLFTGKSHIPSPTKAMWSNNSNSVIGNVKWHFDVVHNTLPKIEFISYADWWWTGSCEYSDLIFGCDSWAEFKHTDMTGSPTNPFLQLYPKTPLPRIFDTKSDIEIIAGVAKSLAKLVKEPRLADMWKFVDEDKVEAYLQRIADASPTLVGYKIEELHKKAANGVPALLNTRTYPRASSFEQAKGEIPWYTKSGRLEFYRPEPEFIENGENLVVHREPIDSTHYEPNVILAKPHVAIRPAGPETYGLARDNLSTEVRQVRHVLMTPAELLASVHPLKAKGFGTHVYHTPKYRHGAHTTPVDTDFTGVLFGPFGDVYRHDRRLPSVTEGYVDINPDDAQAMGIDDGEYVWIDADPEDRPYRGWKEGSPEMKVSRLLLRARYYPGTPKGIARTWHNMYGATFGSVLGHETRTDGLAKNPETNYQAMYRYGSHQSATRAWLKPTLMTDSLVHKGMFGQLVSKGFEPDIHCPVGAPRESFVKISKAEPASMKGTGRWRPVALGLRPKNERETMKIYLAGGFVKT